MRSLRVLAAGTFLLVALAGLVLLALLDGTHAGGVDRAIALSPTPVPFEIEWSVDIAGQPIAGRAVRVSAVAVPRNAGGSFGARAKAPSYRLTVEGGSAPLELTTAAKVTPGDVLDGATWELLAAHDGAVTLTFALDYTLSYDLTGTPPGSYQVTVAMPQGVTVRALLGDASCDGSVDPRDAALVLQFEAMLIEELRCSAGDTNGDGLTNSLDAARLLQYAAGLLPELEGRLTG